ncbi:helix-turn-helix transcriptional regulator [Eisenbergiella tayi]
MLHLPENLKKYRLLKNLTQEDVAEYLGITAQSVSKWERGVSQTKGY